jgi:hypothetical protein
MHLNKGVKMQPIRMSEFATELNADDIKALAQLLVYRTPNRVRVIAAVKYLTRMIYASQQHMYIAKNVDACVTDTTILLLKAMVTAADPPKPRFWQVKRVIRWVLLKALRAI